MKFLLFLISNVIISIVVEKRSKVLTVCQAILFSVFLVISCFVGDVGFILKITENLVGSEAFRIISESFNEHFELLGLEYNVVMLLQVICAISFLLAAIIITFKVFSIKLKLKLIHHVITSKIIELKSRIKTFTRFRRVYLLCARLRI